MAQSNYTGGRFQLELDDHQPVGFVTSVDGGHFKSEPVASSWGSSSVTSRYAGRPKYEDITITTGMAMAPSFWKWIESTLANKPERRNGAIVTYDFNGKERMRRTFKRALISEIGFPALDPSSKAGALLTIKISPEKLEYKDGDGSQLRLTQGQNELSKQKLWLVSNFRLSLQRIKNGEDSLRGAKLEAFTVKQNVITNPVGPELEPRKEPGRVELPSLQLSVTESAVKEWMAWYDETVVQGKPVTTTGAIAYWASDLRTELARLELDGVTLSSVELDKLESGKESVARARITLYLETIKLKKEQGMV